jgi:hypothetical protein
MSVIARWYCCEECGRVGPMADFQDECRPGMTHGKLWGVDLESPALAAYRGAVRLTDEQWARVLGWLHMPVPPGPAKALDESIIRAINEQRGQ